MAVPVALQLSTIGQVSIRARDIKRATDFYRNVMGMRFLSGTDSLSFFDCDGVRLMLDVPEGDRFDHPGSIIYYRVPDIQMATEQLRERNVPVIGEPERIVSMPTHDLWMAFFEDTEGNVFSLMSEVPKGD